MGTSKNFQKNKVYHLQNGVKWARMDKAKLLDGHDPSLFSNQVDSHFPPITRTNVSSTQPSMVGAPLIKSSGNRIHMN